MKDNKITDEEVESIKGLYMQSKLGVDSKIDIINTATTQVNIPSTGSISSSSITTASSSSNFDDYLNNYNQGLIYNSGVSASGGLAQAQITYTNQDMKELRDTPMYDNILFDYSKLLLAHLRLRDRLITNLDIDLQLTWGNQVNVAANILAQSISAAWGHGYPNFRSVRVFNDGTFEIIAMI